MPISFLVQSNIGKVSSVRRLLQPTSASFFHSPIYSTVSQIGASAPSDERENLSPKVRWHMIQGRSLAMLDSYPLG